MARKYLAFDIETASMADGASSWKEQRPLGITCIASQSTDAAEPTVWLTRADDGTPAARMSREDCAAFVQHLGQAARDGYTPLTWNGLGFDFDILAEESGCSAECRQLALDHVDMMFHVVCEKGFPVALTNAAAGLGVAGKLSGVTGADAPGMWARGEFDAVMRYVGQDVRATLAVALESERRKSFAWKTRKGSTSTLHLPDGWLLVRAARELPLPDTSWMSDPLSRDAFDGWIRCGPPGDR